MSKNIPGAVALKPRTSNLFCPASQFKQAGSATSKVLLTAQKHFVKLILEV